MSEIERLRDMLVKQHVPFDITSRGITFWLGGNECWANLTDSGELFGGVGLTIRECGRMRDAEHMLRWCRWKLGLEDE